MRNQFNSFFKGTSYFLKWCKVGALLFATFEPRASHSYSWQLKIPKSARWIARILIHWSIALFVWFKVLAFSMLSKSLLLIFCISLCSGITDEEYQPLLPHTLSTSQILLGSLRPVDSRRWRRKPWTWRVLKLVKVGVRWLCAGLRCVGFVPQC